MSEFEKLAAIAGDTTATSYERRQAIDELAKQRDDRTVAVLASLLDEKDRYFRREVIAALSRMRISGVVEPLLRALQDDDENIRRDAAAALGKCRDPRALEPLKGLLSDSAYFVRDAAERAVNELQEAGIALDAGEQPEPDRVSEADQPVAPESDQPAETPAPPAATPATEEEDQPPRAEPPATEPPATEPPAAEIPLATIVDDSTPRDTVAAEPSPVAEPAPTVEPAPAAEPVPDRQPPTTIRWSACRRMRAFFGDELPDLQSDYEELFAHERRLRELDAEHQQVVSKFDWEQADKGDDLEELEAQIDEAESAITKLRREAANIRVDQNRVERDATSIGHQLAALVWTDKQRELDRQRGSLKSRLKTADEKLSWWQTQLEALHDRHERLRVPLEKLQAETRDLVHAKQAAADAFHRIRKEIDQRILGLLRTLPEETLTERLQMVCSDASRAENLRLVIDELRQWLVEATKSETELQAVQQRFKLLQDTTANSTSSLAEAISDGFEIVGVERETTVRLRARVRFKEKSSFAGGYSNADGSAEGTGSATASYTIDEIHWRPTADHAERIRQFAESWDNLGELAARQQMLEAEQAASERCVDECVCLLRLELERDFHEVY